MQNLILLLAGAFGALAKDCVQDNAIILPKLEDGIFKLGFIGAILVGAFVGFVVDHDPLTAALGGYVGISIIDNILPRKTNDPKSPLE
jgi:hypothetical protein